MSKFATIFLGLGGKDFTVFYTTGFTKTIGGNQYVYAK